MMDTTWCVAARTLADLACILRFRLPLVVALLMLLQDLKVRLCIHLLGADYTTRVAVDRDVCISDLQLTA